jgi:hypothetical protein
MPENEIKKLLLTFRKSIEFNSKYSSINSSKGALLQEALKLFSFLAKKNSLDSARKAVIQDNIFTKVTRD